MSKLRDNQIGVSQGVLLSGPPNLIVLLTKNNALGSALCHGDRWPGRNPLVLLWEKDA
jgi:hypothetical protein